MERSVVDYGSGDKKTTLDTGPICFPETFVSHFTQKKDCLATPQRLLLKSKLAQEIMTKQWLSALKGFSKSPLLQTR